MGQSSHTEIIGALVGVMVLIFLVLSKQLSSSIQRCNQGLDRELLWKYFLAFKEKWWELFWGPTVLGVVFGIATIWYPPARIVFFIYVLIVAFLAGYYLWRDNYVRLIPKLGISGTRFQDTPVTSNDVILDHRVFVQLTPECLTESPVYECVGYLQKIEKRVEENQWEETALDRNLVLNWGEDKVELHPRSEIPLNIFFIQRNTRQIIPNLKPGADIPWQKFDAALNNEPILRFHVQITCSERIHGNFVSIPPVSVCLEVRFVGPNFLRPQLQLISAP
jgi:hypothetical protein